MDTSIVTHTGAEYQRKTKDVSNKFDNSGFPFFGVLNCMSDDFRDF